MVTIKLYTMDELIDTLAEDVVSGVLNREVASVRVAKAVDENHDHNLPRLALFTIKGSLVEEEVWSGCIANLLGEG